MPLDPSSLSGPGKCPNCGAPLPRQAPQGLCPKCLFAGLAVPTEDGAGAPAPVPSQTPEELAPHFPQLEILECLGRGGMGVVYKARQKSLNRFVALKLLAPERVTDAKFAQRFTHEAQALAALNHPNIVTIHDFGQAGGFYFLLMEFVDGVNLRQAMKAGRFTPEQALAIVPPVCEALQYAHEHGIVHRDIKPENLLLDKEGRVKIADFGIAKMLGSDADTNVRDEGPQAGTLASVAGTPQYMAPEQKAHRAADHRADIYSLGVVLYELLTGELPADRLQPPSRKVQIDVRLDEIVLRALEKTPELRYQTAGEFRTQVVAMTGRPPENAAPTAVNTPSAAEAAEEDGGPSLIAWAWKCVPLIAVLLAFFNPWGERAWYYFAAGCSILAVLPAFGIGRGKKKLRRDSAGPSAQPAADSAPAGNPEARFAVTAIVGAAWMPFAVAAAVFWISVGVPFSKFNLGAALAIFASLSGIFGSTVLGWVAVSQIRRSAGRLHGMWLAVFDGLFFPLLGLDLLIVGIASFLFRSAISRNRDLLFTPGDPPDFSDAPLRTKFLLAGFIALGLALIAWVDFLIVRKAWRAVHRPLDGDPADGRSQPSGRRSEAGFGRWLRKFFLVQAPIAIVVALIVRTFFLQPFTAATDAAAPEIPRGSHVLVWKLAHTFAAGDLIAYTSEGRANLGRVVGSEGGVISVKRNGEADTVVPRDGILGKVISIYWRASNEPAIRPAVTFGPVIERVLPFDRSCIDFQTGNVLQPELQKSPPFTPEQWDAWIKQTGADAMVEEASKMPQLNADNYPRLVALNNDSCVFVAEETADFDSVRASDAEARLKVAFEGKLSWDTTHGRSHPLWFRTKDGATGVLQILGTNDKPRGLKIRYKLVVPTPAASQVRSRTPKSAHITRNAGTVLVHHDDVDLHYVFFAPKAVGSSGSDQYDTGSLAWRDHGSFKLTEQQTFGYDRESTDPFHLQLNGKEYDLRQGRVFVPHDDGTVEQLKLFPSLATASNPDELAKLIPPARTMNDEPITVEKLRQQLEAAESQLQDALKTCAPTHPFVMEVHESIAALKQKIKVAEAESRALSFVPIFERVVDGAIDFDSGKVSALPENLSKSNDLAENVLKAVEWLEHEGMDAITEPSQSLKGVNLKAKSVDNEAWDNLTPEQIIATLEVTKREAWQDLDPNRKTDEQRKTPVTWVFETREGGKGILQVLEYLEQGVKVRYKLVQGLASSPTTSATARRSVFGLQAERTITPRDANRDGVVAFRFKDNFPVLPPDTLTGHFQKRETRGFTPELKQWMLDQQVDLLLHLEEKEYAVLSLDMRSGFAGQPMEWDTIPPDRAAPLLAGLEKLNTNPGSGVLSGCGYRDGLSSVNVFRTRDGLVGFYQVRGLADAAGRGVVIRYQLVQDAHAQASIPANGIAEWAPTGTFEGEKDGVGAKLDVFKGGTAHLHIHNKRDSVSVDFTVESLGAGRFALRCDYRATATEKEGSVRLGELVVQSSGELLLKIAANPHFLDSISDCDIPLKKVVTQPGNAAPAFGPVIERELPFHGACLNLATGQVVPVPDIATADKVRALHGDVFQFAFENDLNALMILDARLLELEQSDWTNLSAAALEKKFTQDATVRRTSQNRSETRIPPGVYGFKKWDMTGLLQVLGTTGPTPDQVNAVKVRYKLVQSGTDKAAASAATPASGPVVKLSAEVTGNIVGPTKFSEVQQTAIAKAALALLDACTFSEDSSDSEMNDARLNTARIEIKFTDTAATNHPDEMLVTFPLTSGSVWTRRGKKVERHAKFTPEAAAALSAVLQSTPSGAPTTATVPGADAKPAFGPMIERVLPSGEPCREQYFQFHSGEIFVVGNGPGTSADEAAFDQKRIDDAGGVDMSVISGDKGIQIAGRGCFFTRDVADSKWDRFTADQAVESVKSVSFVDGVVSPKKGEFPITYLFKTARGEVGIMEVLGTVEVKHGDWSEHGMKFRYKLVQGTGTTTITPSKITLPQLNFGKETQGLQAALTVTPGEPFGLRIYLRNVSDKAIAIDGASYRQEDECLLTDQDGKPVPITRVTHDIKVGMGGGYHGPGQVAIFESAGLSFQSLDKVPSSAGYVAQAKPGRYTLRMKLRLPGDDVPFAPNQGVWRGELETGPVTIEVKDPATQKVAPVADAIWSSHLGKPVEITVNDLQTTRENCALSLDTGKLLPVPASITLDALSQNKMTKEPAPAVAEAWVRAQEEALAWARNNQVDAVAFVTTKEGKVVKCGLLCPDLLVFHVENKAWTPDLADARMLKEHFDKAMHEWNMIPQIAEITSDGQFPETYLILDTRTHRRGVLQILGTSDNPCGVKISYRLIEGAAVKKITQAAHTGVPLPKAVKATGSLVAGSQVAPTAGTTTKWVCWAPVTEADITAVSVGQEVSMTLDAFPKRVFKGKVAYIGDTPVTTQNSVTYETLIDIADPEQQFKEGMTVNVMFSAEHREEGLKTRDSTKPAAIADPLPAIELKVAQQQLVKVLGELLETQATLASELTEKRKTHPAVTQLERKLQVLEQQAAELRARIQQSARPNNEPQTIPESNPTPTQSDSMKTPRIASVLAAAFSLSSASADTIQHKAESIIIPKFDLRAATTSEAFKAFTKATDIKVIYIPSKDDAAAITVSLSSVPAAEVLAYITELANLKFTYAEDGVHVITGKAPAPANLKDKVTLTVGKDLAVQFQEQGDTLSQPTVVEKPDAKTPTVTFSLKQGPQITSLIRKNPFNKTLNFRALIRLKGSKDYVETSITPTIGGTVRGERLQGPVEEVILFEFKLTP